MGSSTFFHDSHIEQDLPVVDEKIKDKEFAKRQEALEKKKNDEGLWKMYFDGSIRKELVQAFGLFIQTDTLKYIILNLHLNVQIM